MLKNYNKCLLALLGFALPVAAYSQSKAQVDYVNPFIGTGGHGHTHPSALAPWGMIQAGPDTRVQGWDSASGYYYGDPTIIGFTHSHLSGTGAIDRLDLLIMPLVGDNFFERGKENNPKQGYRSAYRNEVASPGYYGVELLDDMINVDIAASSRAAIHHYRFSARKAGERRLLIDLKHRPGDQVVDSSIKQLSQTRVVGKRNTSNWAKDQTVYYCMDFSQPVKSVLRQKQLKASFAFGTEIQDLKVKVGISPVDEKGACRNLDHEIPHWNHVQVHQETRAKWSELLSRVDIEDSSEDKKTIYYTAMYHSLLAPNIYMDVDGRYRSMDKKIRQGSLDQPYFTIYSIWDTYRALHPFLNIFKPELNGQMIQALLHKYETYGRMPEWELENYDTRIMIGYHGTSLIADAWAKGVRNFDSRLALEAMLNAAHENKKEITALDELGYVPHDYVSRGYKESASITLEYAYDDWTIAKYMTDLAKDGPLEQRFPKLMYQYPNAITKFKNRSRNFENIFDPSTGFFRPRYKSGAFMDPFDPNLVTHRNNGFTEANAWQYLWSVPHDIPRLIELLGGPIAFADKLDQLFVTKPSGNKSPDVSGLIGNYAHGNEPGHHIPFLYNYVDQPSKTQYWVRRIMRDMYGSGPDGLAGNEDCGQMSAWYLMNAMGLYSVTPGSSEYQLGSPQFGKMSMKLENGKTLNIVAHGNSDKNIYVSKVIFNGQLVDGSTIDHREIMAGGTLEFFMTDKS